MQNVKKNCPNMNHGKTNSSISYCPNCGGKFASGAVKHKSCSEESHRIKRKDRSHFCCDCGKDLHK